MFHKAKIMKTSYLIIIILMLSYGALSAQNSISGSITDEDNRGILLVTVALYRTADSTVVAAASTDMDGKYSLADIEDGEYYLSATMLGYKNHTIPLIQVPSDKQVFDITMEEDAVTLSTVEVSAKIPLMEQKSDRLVVNIERMLTTVNTTLLGVMKKVPGMLVINDRLSMAGQSNITILINGRSTKYMDVQSLLRDIPGDNVKQVEIIHQPGAEFDAEGTGPVINIILKKNSLLGTNGSFNVVLGKDQGLTTASWLNLSHYQGGLNLRGRLFYVKDQTLDEYLITRRIKGDVYQQHSRSIETPTIYKGSFGADWEISDHHSLGASLQYTDNSKVIDGTNTTQVNFANPEEGDLDILTLNDATEAFDLLNVNAYYQLQFDTAAHKLSFDVQMVRLNNKDVSLLTTEEFNVGRFFPNRQYIQPGSIDINAFQMDYDRPFAGGLFEVGGKYSTANLDNDLQAFIGDSENTMSKDLEQSNHYLFDETIKAAYGKFTFEQGAWSGTLGLRFEESNSEGRSLTLDSTITRDISKLFPSFSIARQLNDVLGTTFAYSYRIDRPNYQVLNPFVYSLDPYTSQRGNPVLIPTLTHSMKFNLTYEREPFLNFEYKISKDPMVEVTQQDDESGETFLTMVNLEKQKVFNTSFMFPLQAFFPIEGFAGITATNIKYDSEFIDQRFERSRWNYTAFLSMFFSLPLDIDGELSAWYNSGGIDGIMENEWMYGVNFGFSKQLFDNKLIISLEIEDLFNRFANSRIRFANMNIDITNRWYTPVINGKVTYNFGNRYLDRAKERTGSATSEIERTE
jgi:hypothetical protein